MKMARQLMIVVAAILLCSTTAFAKGDKEADEKVAIDYLLNSISNSSCQFVRNGKQHSPEEAADHLSMKYSRAKRHIKSPEDFIDKLASESSWTGKPYTIRCPQSAEQLSSDWLYQRLESYRSQQGETASTAPAP